ncbi:50S ribosomal protein L3 N(5)-glutamine methyltransferase [Salinispirillum marinum]|uniref:50S ribosomal protein L3 N(5)-glutamine methyltransferase n=2 Tax=Saccharospirillaceae TaxID=255527 RepID=A0ABV8BHM6_9GAMM
MTSLASWHDPEEFGVLETIGDFVRWCSSEMIRHGVYFGHGSDNAWDEATYLVLSAASQPLAGRLELLQAKLLPSERLRIVEWLGMRIEQRLPLPYITGEAWFAGRPYWVNADVLIPRSPFAELINQHGEPWLQAEPTAILDMCTGSGCIGIAAALEFHEATVDLVDISPAALQVAERNIARHGVDDRVRTYLSDGFSALPEQGYDVILANPPYVDQEDLAEMPPEYQHEPALALGSGEDGLDLTRQLLAQAHRFLAPEGLLFLEVGNSAAALDEAFPELPFTWLEFADGGHGICVISREDLLAARVGG